jgi:hypothetical protein
MLLSSYKPELRLPIKANQRKTGKGTEKSTETEDNPKHKPITKPRNNTNTFNPVQQNHQHITKEHKTSTQLTQQNQTHHRTKNNNQTESKNGKGGKKNQFFLEL